MPLDRFDCYELCVQSPPHVAAFLLAVHGGEPEVLREDFCGTAAVSRAWCAARVRTAVAVDLDPEAIAKAHALAAAAGCEVRVRLALADTVQGDDQPGLRGASPGCDVVFVGNFSIGYIHTRAALVAYLRDCKRRLEQGPGGRARDRRGGVFVCDTYGGAGAFRLGGLTRTHPSRGREVVRYHWVHESADPLTGMVENSIGFRVELDGEVVQELPRAFVYRWRLWSIHELREAMAEAGFQQTAVYRDVNIAPGQAPEPVTDPRELGEDWIVLVVGQA